MQLRYSKYDLLQSLKRIARILKQISVIGIFKWDVQLLEETIEYVENTFPNEPIAIGAEMRV